MFTLSHKLSAMSFGQDRYRRRYWVLPKCGGIFVEGLESGEPESADQNAPVVDKKTEEPVDEDKCLKSDTPANEAESTVKEEQTEKSYALTDTDHICVKELKTEDLTNQPYVDNGKPSPELAVCDKMDVQNDDCKAESDTVKADSCSALKAELVSLNCLIGTDVKINGDISKNGFVDLKNCIRPDGDNIKVEMPSVSATASDRTQGNLADDGSLTVKEEMPTTDTQLISITANPSESATNDSIQSSSCSKPSDDQLPRMPSKDDISLLQHSNLLLLSASDVGLTQFGATSHSVGSSQRTSQVATPSSEVGAGQQLDLSTGGTPVSFMQPSRTSTPGYLSSFADDLQLSADGELQPDYLAIPQNVKPITLGNLLCVCRLV